MQFAVDVDKLLAEVQAAGASEECHNRPVRGDELLAELATADEPAARIRAVE